MTDAPDRRVWEAIVKAGWGPGYAGGRVLSLLRTCAPCEDAAARWYYRQMVEHGSLEDGHQSQGAWIRALAELWEWLTPEEHARLRA